jgi:hypothetical protein
MNSTAIAQQPEKLPLLIERAAAALASATTAAEILEARDRANIAYTAAKMAARLAKAKQAHDEIIAACQKAMADALMIEQQAQHRLAEEYDAAQERGDAATHSSGNPQIVPNRDDLKRPATAADLGLTHKQIYEARLIRDAEKADPGFVRRVLEEKIKAGGEPTRADIRREAIRLRERTKTLKGYAIDFTRTLVPYRQADWLGKNPEQAHGDFWLNTMGAMVALKRFAEFTIANINSGDLKITGDPECLREWREWKEKVEAYLKEDRPFG